MDTAKAKDELRTIYDAMVIALGDKRAFLYLYSGQFYLIVSDPLQPDRVRNYHFKYQDIFEIIACDVGGRNMMYIKIKNSNYNVCHNFDLTFSSKNERDSFYTRFKFFRDILSGKKLTKNLQSLSIQPKPTQLMTKPVAFDPWADSSDDDG